VPGIEQHPRSFRSNIEQAQIATEGLLKCQNLQPVFCKPHHGFSRAGFSGPFIAFTRIALVVLAVIALWGSLDLSLAGVVEETVGNIDALKYYSPKTPK